ncbi:unnamed protein product [Tuber aestivum]|uniref:Uncharacterized protein n=1 Tax=Tuber aestivum TaxID=59557 RepID=A0A292Q8Z3_9PEZI|nr:unnamed protein product [Tuber aestivum]
MAYGCYFSVVILALWFMTTFTVAAPTDDCNIGISGEQATTLKAWVTESPRAVGYVLTNDPVLEEVAKKKPAMWGKGEGEGGKARVTEVLEGVHMTLNGQKMFLKGKGENPGTRGIPQGWSDAVKSEDQSVQDDFKKSMQVKPKVGSWRTSTDSSFRITAALVKEGLGEEAAKEAAVLEESLPGERTVEPKRPEAPPEGDC